MTFAPGTVLERYTVEGVLGQGGMAIVYRVRHNQLGTIHALKVLHAPNPAVRERFLQEGRVQGQLRHPNIVPVTDLIEISGSSGLVMEFVDGPSLEALLERYQPTLEQADALAIGILEGVTHAHRHGFIHRDLKPANVLLAVTSNGLVPKVADFGLAKLVRGDADGLGHTRSGMVMGTPSYMAPEQIRDSKNVDHRADIFSLGVILYELLAGSKPFEGADIVQLYTAITKGKYRPISELVPGIPDRMERAIVGALAIDKNLRIQDCEKLLATWRGDGRARAHSTWGEAFVAAEAAMPERFVPQPVGDVEKEITFHDAGPTPTAVPTTDDHPVFADLGRIRIARPSEIGELPAMSINTSLPGTGPALDLSIGRGTPAPASSRLAAIDPSGQLEEDDDDVPQFGRGVAPVVAMVAVGLFVIAVLGVGGAVVAGVWVFPGATATAVEPPPVPAATEGEGEPAPAPAPAPVAAPPTKPVAAAAPASSPAPERRGTAPAAASQPPSAPVTAPPPAKAPAPAKAPEPDPTPPPAKAPPPAPEPEPEPEPSPDPAALIDALGDDEPAEPEAAPAPTPTIQVIEVAPAPAEPASLDTPPASE